MRISAMHLSGILFVFALSLKIVLAAEWCYQSQVTCNNTCLDAWQVFQQCSGRSQSPVNIMMRKTVRDERLSPFQLNGYQKTFHSPLINNGHTVPGPASEAMTVGVYIFTKQLDLPPGMKVSGGHLSAHYKALQLHFHWGKDGSPGSEHTVDGEQFPMEMHIVHIKEEYDSLAQAVKDKAGVAVLGFFFQESISTNEKYIPLVDGLKQIIEPSSNTTLSDVSLEMLIPPQNDLKKYFRYDGSLTTPDCAEAVVWTLFESTIPLSRNQLSAFCQLRFSDGTQMIQNYRPVQALNERLVYYSKGHISVVSWVLLIMSVLSSSHLHLHSDA